MIVYNIKECTNTHTHTHTAFSILTFGSKDFP